MDGGVAYKSKTDLVADALKEMIHAGDLAPGTVLRQRDVADRLGVSPTPVREALRRLEAEGFIVSEPHRAAVVVRSENTRLYENALIRAALEGLGAELAAAKVNDDDLREIEGHNERLRTASDRGTAAISNRLFHFRIYQVADSPILLAQLNLLWRALGDGPAVDRSLEQSAAQHDEIVAALRAGDPAAAADATRRHIIDAFAPLAP